MTVIKLRHYAFQEGARGFRAGAGLGDNPYYGEGGDVPSYNAEAWEQWREGWKSAEFDALPQAEKNRRNSAPYGDCTPDNPKPAPTITKHGWSR